MAEYFSLLSLATPLDLADVSRVVRLACADLYRVEWRRGCLSSDGTRMLCWYRAPDAEAVRFVLRQQGCTSATIWAGDVNDATEALPCDGSPHRFVVDVSCSAGELTSTRAAICAELEAAGLSIVRIFTALDGTRLVCLVATADEVTVSNCLQAARLAGATLWRGVEFDAAPSQLFRSGDSADAVASPRNPETRGPRPAAAGQSAASEGLDAVIIGAGLSGICALERLVRMGLRVRVYESGNDVGGVWYWNRYPGARVDSETYTYGFSFSDALLREWDWRELFSAQPEIWSYLRYVVDRLDLRKHVRFNTRVNAARFDESTGCWSVETDSGDRVSARFLIPAAGTLSEPQMPDYPGIDEFGGQSHHTARWPAEGVALTGRRVGVIGTGASGVQVIQTIASAVSHLTVFQRTPTYCIPQRNHTLTDEERRNIRRDWEAILAACRESYGGFVHTFDSRPGLPLSTDAREAKFEALWNTPGFAFWFGNFADLMMNDEVNAHACEFIRRKIRARIHDPDVARRLLPDHPFGTKRVPLENGYYEAYNRPNVSLVDLRETPIVRITKAGVLTSKAEHALDVIVYATGFDAGTGTLIRIDIRGDDGLSIAEKWRQGPKTYLGLLVSGFPNLFLVNGPHNAAALCNAGRCVEQNVDWIARCIEQMQQSGLTRVVPSEAAENEWTRHVYETAEASVLTRMTNSWFFGANTPGKPRRATIYAGGAREHREHCENVASAGYPGLRMS